MNNPDNTVGVDVFFPKLGGRSTWLMSEVVDIPEGSDIEVNHIEQAIIGTVCASCQFKGNICNSSFREDPTKRCVSIENLHKGRSGYLVPENIPDGCLLMGNAYTYRYNPKDPSQFVLVPAPDTSHDVRASE